MGGMTIRVTEVNRQLIFSINIIEPKTINPFLNKIFTLVEIVDDIVCLIN